MPAKTGTNKANAKKYAKELMKLAGNVGEKIIMPVFREAAADLVEVSASLAPHNTGLLRSLFTITVNDSGRLPSNDNLENIRSTAISNMRKAKLTDRFTLENQAPYSETYEYGLFDPATPKYTKLGGSEARHVPKSRRSEKLGKVLIVSGFNVTAPDGMVNDALQIVNSWIAGGVYKLGKF